MKLRYFLLLFLMALQVNAQEKKPDSLLHQLAAVTKLPEKNQIRMLIGIEYYQNSEAEKALPYLTESAQNAIREKDFLTAIRSLNNLGNIYADKGDNTKALGYYQQSLGMAIKIKDHKNIAHVEKNIGTLFISWKRLDEALEYYDKAEKEAIVIKDSALLADCYNNKGTVYEQQLHFADALNYYNKALKYYTANKLEDNRAMSFINIAVLYKSQKDFKNAIDYNNRAILILEKTGDKFMSAAVLTNTGNVLMEKGDYASARAYHKKSIDLARQIDAKEILINAYENLAEVAARSGNFQEAFTYQKSTALIKDSFINTESTRQLQEMEVKFETARKEKELAVSLADNALAAIKIQKKNVLLSATIAGIFALCILVFLIRRNATLRQNKMHQDAELQQLLAQQRLQDEKLRISQDLHDNIGAQLTYINSSLENLQQTSTEDIAAITETKNITLNTIKELRSMVWLINKQEFSLDELSIRMREYCKPFQTGERSVMVQVSGDGNCTLQGITATHIFRILQEAINNAVKYSEATLIEITIDHSISNVLKFSVIDNGKGFDTGHNFSSFGLQNIQARANALKAGFAILSKAGSGTSILLSMPVEF